MLLTMLLVVEVYHALLQVKSTPLAVNIMIFSPFPTLVELLYGLSWGIGGGERLGKNVTQTSTYSYLKFSIFL